MTAARIFRFVVFATFTFTLLGKSAVAITLTGVTGKAVEFAGIKEATPKGITGQVTPESSLIGVPWDKLDLEALKTDNWMIYSAYELAIAGETIALNLGTYADPDAGETTNQYAGWIGTNVGGVDFFIRSPLGKAPIRGILFIAEGDFSYSMPRLVPDEGAPDPWGEFLNKHRFVLMSYEFEHQTEDKTKVLDFAFADKRSGKMIVDAIRKLADAANRPELIDLPIALYGSERTGATLAYSFLHWKPEKVIAAVMVKGAFYEAEPTEATLKIPSLFLWGHYGDNAERWGSENTVASLFEMDSVRASNWTSAREFRGKSIINPATEYFGRKYLMEMIELRVPEELFVEVKPEEKSGEETSDGESSAEVETKPVMERVPLIPLNRDDGYVGVIRTSEFEAVKDPSAVIAEGETFIPNIKVSTVGKAYGKGSLENY